MTSSRIFDVFPGTIKMDAEAQRLLTSEPHSQGEAGSWDDVYAEHHPAVRDLLRRERIPQHTPEWKLRRQQMITGTNAAPIIGSSPYETPESIFKRKTGQKPEPEKNYAMNHGNYFEPEARRVFELVTRVALCTDDIGLVEHTEYSWLGASPDGVCKYYPFLIEIKCPLRAVIAHECPDMYYAQIQQQLQVCDLPVCFLVQYSPPNQPLRLGHIDIVTVKRDDEFWRMHFPTLARFWTRVQEYWANTEHSTESVIAEWTDHKVTKKRKAPTKKPPKTPTCALIVSGTEKKI